MALYDRKFEILRPTMDKLIRDSGRVVANPLLLDPTNALALIDGEWMQIDSSDKLIRTADASKPSFAVIDERGDYGVQAHKKPTIVLGTYVASTMVYADAITAAAFGQALEVGTVNVARLGGVARQGLVARTTGLIVGYVLKSGGATTKPIEFMSTLA